VGQGFAPYQLTILGILIETRDSQTRQENVEASPTQRRISPAQSRISPIQSRISPIQSRISPTQSRMSQGKVSFRMISRSSESWSRHVVEAYTPLHSEPYNPPTLHSTPFTLHLTPNTLHPTPYTLHSTPYTLQPTNHIHTLHSTPYALNPMTSNA